MVFEFAEFRVNLDRLNETVSVLIGCCGSYCGDAEMEEVFLEKNWEHIACIGDSNFACEMVTTLLGFKIGIQGMKDSVQKRLKKLIGEFDT